MYSLIKHVSSIKKNGKPFLLFGNNISPAIKEILDGLGIDVYGVIDDDDALNGTENTFYGVIHNFEYWKNKGLQRFNFVIVIDYFLSITKRLKEEKIDEDSIVWLNNGSIEGINDVTFMVNHYKDFMDNITLFDDEKSRAQYWQMCLYRMDLNIERIKSIQIDSKNQYFDSIVKLGDSESYCDIGAFDGKTIQKFISHASGVYKKIFAIEASISNMILMKDRLKGISNIEYLQYAVMDKSYGMIKFDENRGSGSRIDEYGSLLVPTYCLDDLIKEEVTYIKADIEGCETAALEGMKGIIDKYHPKLAICIYHSSEDMLRLPRLIKSLCPWNRLFFRQHGEGMNESVCYSLP